MSPLLVAMLGVLLAPLFIATWRTSLFGLGCQGLILALIAHRLDPAPHGFGPWLTLFDAAIVRGVVAPFALYAVLRARNAPSRNDVIPPNLLSWTMALGLVLFSFSGAELLVSGAGEQRMLVAVAMTGVMLGFLVLASQSGPFSQMVGALRIENAIALLELGGARHALALPLRLALMGVFVVTVLLFRWYLWLLGEGKTTRESSGGGVEGPTL